MRGAGASDRSIASIASTASTAIALALVTACGRLGFDDVSTGDAGPDAFDFDALPGCAVGRPVPTTGVVSGTLTAGASMTEGSCDGMSTSEDIWWLDVEHPNSTIQVATDTAAIETTLYVRTACDDASTELECDREDGIADKPLITRAVTPGRYFITVDGRDGMPAGDYEGLFQVLLPVNAPCSAANMRDRCGPSLQCVITACRPQISPCEPSGAELLPAGNPKVVMADTRTASNLHAAHLTTTCGAGGDNGLRGNEKIYRLELASPASQVVVSTVSPNTDFDTLVYVRRDSCVGADVGCHDDIPSSRESELILGPLAAGTYFVFIDAFGPQSGRAEVTVTITP